MAVHTTPRGFPYVDTDEPPNGPAQLQALAEFSDGMWISVATFGALPAFGVVGREAYVTGTGEVYLDIGTAWVRKGGSNTLRVADIGVAVQTHDDDLDAIAGLGTQATGRDLLTAASQADIRAKAGLGSMATQAAGAVAITGGNVTGIADLAVADGGTGASNAAAARGNLGAAAAALPGWTALPRGADWNNQNQTTSYRRDDNGEVRLKGQLFSAGGAAFTTVVGTLPAGYRPPQNMWFTCALWNGSANHAAMVMVESATGNIIIEADLTSGAGNAPAGSIISLDGIRFDNA